ncbi:MAG: hypothetical protein AAF493_30175 [Pseudomonadota bacterium]
MRKGANAVTLLLIVLALGTGPRLSAEGVRQSCVDFGVPKVVGHIHDARLAELSGLSASTLNDGILWAVSDSGAPRIYAMSTTGTVLGALYLRGAFNLNWEALAVGECDGEWCLFVGDIGDDYGVRPWKTIYRVREPKLASVPFALRTVPWERIRVTYPDRPFLAGFHNAEALGYHPTEGLVIVTKSSGQAHVYALPSSSTGFTKARWVARVATPRGQRITAIDFHPSGVDALVRSYRRPAEDGAMERWRFDPTGPFDPTGRLFPVSRSPIPAATEPQGEVVTYDPDGLGYYHASEIETGFNATPLYYVPCLSAIP